MGRMGSSAGQIIMRPNSTILSNLWRQEDGIGIQLHQSIDEAVPSDVDFISNLLGHASICDIGLPVVAVPVRPLNVFKIRCKRIPFAGVPELHKFVCEVMDGGLTVKLIELFAVPESDTTFQVQITKAEIPSATYALHFLLYGQNLAGDAAYSVSWVEMRGL